MGEEKVLFDVVDGIGAVTFNRPDEANAMDLDVMRRLMHISIECDEDSSIRAVVITGNGRFFSAGGDIATFDRAGDSAGALIKEMTTYYHAALSRFSRMEAPVIAAVNGMAAGAGFSLVAACDLAIGAESSRYTSAYTAASLSPDGASTYFVPRLVGMRRAMELMLTNRRLSAAEALDWGLINQVVPDADLMAEVMELASQLAHGATLAYGTVKSLLHDSLANTLESQMELESRGIAALTHTHDGREGVVAFREKRPPKFEAR
jgi:2-(1,2-epoxy-1,2-dihydrophenyl)acetyl-CoA isomerase